MKLIKVNDIGYSDYRNGDTTILYETFEEAKAYDSKGNLDLRDSMYFNNFPYIGMVKINDISGDFIHVDAEYDSFDVLVDNYMPWDVKKTTVKYNEAV